MCCAPPARYRCCRRGETRGSQEDRFAVSRLCSCPNVNEACSRCVRARYLPSRPEAAAAGDQFIFCPRGATLLWHGCIVCVDNCSTPNMRTTPYMSSTGVSHQTYPPPSRPPARLMAPPNRLRRNGWFWSSLRPRAWCRPPTRRRHGGCPAGTGIEPAWRTGELSATSTLCGNESLVRRISLSGGVVWFGLGSLV